ncbi:MAG: SRPBCC family protein [Acidimicrobiales bacterium]|nr:SRPBCC family protein [Acidimicrobiales bacterium]
MDTSAYRNDTSVVIDRPAAEVYDLVADVSNMGRWSPVATGGAYDDDGEWFTGTNELNGSTWETRCRVEAAERGRRFVFVNHGLEGSLPMVRWGFHFDPLDASSTKVTQTWEVLPTYAEGLGVNEDDGRAVLDMMKEIALSGMPETLAALKLDAESTK